MNYISKPVDQIKNEYDVIVIVIGSGYGGSIAASRLSRAGQKVCLLAPVPPVPPDAGDAEVMFESSLNSIFSPTKVVGHFT